MFRHLWRAALTHRELRGMKFLGDEKTSNRQLIDLQVADSGATNRQAADGNYAHGYGADCNCTQRKPAHCKSAGCKRPQGLRAGAWLSRFTTGGVPVFHAV